MARRFARLENYLWIADPRGLAGIFALELLKNHWRHGYWDIAGAAAWTLVFWLFSFSVIRFVRAVHGDSGQVRE